MSSTEKRTYYIGHIRSKKDLYFDMIKSLLETYGFIPMGSNEDTTYPDLLAALEQYTPITVYYTDNTMITNYGYYTGHDAVFSGIGMIINKTFNVVDNNLVIGGIYNEQE